MIRLFVLVFVWMVVNGCGSVRSVNKHFSRADSLVILKKSVDTKLNFQAYRTIEEYDFTTSKDDDTSSIKKEYHTVSNSTKIGRYRKTTEYISDKSTNKQSEQRKDVLVKVEKQVVKEVPRWFYFAASVLSLWLLLLTLFIIYRSLKK